MENIRSVFAKDCLENKLVLITGATGALGTVIVKYLLYHGAEVIIADIKPLDAATTNAKLHYYPVDVSKEQEVSSFFEKMDSDFDSCPDVVMCHAGVVDLCSFHEFTYSAWQRTFDVNVNGTFFFAKEAVNRMRGKFSYDKPAKIIFTTSWVGEVPCPRLSAYSSSKAAINMLMKTIAREYARDHIRVNCISPGIVSAGMALHAYETDMEYRKEVDKAIPVGPLQTPESVAEGMMFLCSSASNYMTGAILLIDGGNSLYPMS